MSNNLLSSGDKELEEGLLDAVLELSQQVQRQIWWPFVGTSMSPYIKWGDMLLVQHTSHGIRLGDIIVFKRSAGAIAHRVVFIRKYNNCDSIYRTKGDNIRSFDVPISQSVVLGRVVCIQKVSNKSISLEKSHVKLFNFVLALFSYAMGILYQVLRPFFGKKGYIASSSCADSSSQSLTDARPQ